MANDATTYSSYNFDTRFFHVGTSLSDSYTPPYPNRYLVKSIRYSNLTNNGVTITLQAYRADDADTYHIITDRVVAGKETVEVLGNSPLVVDGARGDLLKMAAGTANALDVMITYMVLGRESGL